MEISPHRLPTLRRGRVTLVTVADALVKGIALLATVLCELLAILSALMTGLNMQVAWLTTHVAAALVAGPLGLLARAPTLVICAVGLLAPAGVLLTYELALFDPTAPQRSGGLHTGKTFQAGARSKRALAGIAGRARANAWTHLHKAAMDQGHYPGTSAFFEVPGRQFAAASAVVESYLSR